MHKEHIYYVYFLQSSSRRALYIGMTSNLHRRVYQHKTKEFRGFTFDYDAVRLVYWESFDDVHKAIGREKQLKRFNFVIPTGAGHRAAIICGVEGPCVCFCSARSRRRDLALVFVLIVSKRRRFCLTTSDGNRAFSRR